MRGQNFFKRGLHAGGEVAMTLLERFIRLAGGPQALLEIVREQSSQHRRLIGVAPGHIRALGLMAEVFQTEAERKRAVGVNDPPKLVEKFRLAVSGQAHYFEFVAKFPEADILSQRGVIHAQRMGKGHFAEMPHVRTFAERPHRTGEISQTVGRKYRSAFERRNVKSTGKMRGVMLDPMEFCANGIGHNFKARSQRSEE